MPGLVIFDCDGVLVDSERIVVGIESEALTAAGFPLTMEDIATSYVGLSDAAMYSQIAERFGRAVPPTLIERIVSTALEALEARVTAVPGIAEVLEQLRHEEVTACVASSSPPGRISMSLRVAGLDQHLPPERQFSAAQVERGKPAPDLFLFAAAQMGAEPAACTVIEDSEHGITAALAAGMRAVGLTAVSLDPDGNAARLRQAGAHALATAASELAGLLDP